MPGPKPPQIVVSEGERVALEHVVRAHLSGQALVRRARVVLLAAMGYSNMDIARLMPMDEEAVGLWRRRWAGYRNVPLEAMSASDRLADAERPGAVPRLTAEQVCQIIALACEQPSDSGRPISQWSRRELADEIVSRNHRPHFAAPRCAVVKKRPTCSRTACATGSPRPPTRTATPRSLTCVPCIAPLVSERTRVSTPSALTS
jgi:putative transposase